MAIVVNFKLEKYETRLTYTLSSRTMNVGGAFVWIPASKKGSGSQRSLDYQKLLIRSSVLLPTFWPFSSMYSFPFLVRAVAQLFYNLSRCFYFSI